HPVTDEHHHQVHGAVLRGADVVVRVVEVVTVRVGDGADLARAGDDLDLPTAGGDDLKVFKVQHVRGQDGVVTVEEREHLPRSRGDDAVRVGGVDLAPHHAVTDAHAAARAQA